MISPTLSQTTRALIAKTVADLDSLSSKLKAVLPTVKNAQGADQAVAIPTTQTNGEYDKLKFGPRAKVPDELSLMFIPRPFRTHLDSAPNGARRDYEVRIEIYWQDSALLKLSSYRDVLHQMMTDLSEVTVDLLGLSSLTGNPARTAWDASGSGDYVLNPFCHVAMPTGEYELKQNQFLLCSILTWTAQKYYLNP